ncbi:MAG: YeeE/YedE family protein [Nitrospirae bacterium]|nr:YeeE/YedE family protein [Nitrospirota bacterium]
MINDKDIKAWSPYLAGGLTGAVIILSAWIAKQYFGSSACFVRFTGFIEQFFASSHSSGLEYFQRFAPEVDWQAMLVLGILIGSFISAKSDGSFRLTAVPDLWASRFGQGKLRRGIFSFIGGIILMFGARLAGGCPSGYGLAALVQLAVSGLIVLVCFFAGGIVFAKIIYRGDERK